MLGILVYGLVRDTQHMPTLEAQIGIAPAVMFHLIARIVRSAIYLDDEFSQVNRKIGYIGTYWVLSAKNVTGFP